MVLNPSNHQSNPWQTPLIASPLMRVENMENKGGFEGPQIASEYIVPVTNDTVFVNNSGGNDKQNPFGPARLGDFRDYYNNILASIYLEVTPFEWLTFRTLPSVDANFNRYKNWLPSFEMGVRSKNQASMEEWFYEGLTYSLENQLTFSNTYGKHNITTTVVHHVRRLRANEVLAEANGFPYENLTTIGASAIDGRQVVGSFHPFSSISYLGRIIYDYGKKYLLTASFRRDGNSRFGPLNRWGDFPSLSLAYKLNEDFLTSIEEISLLKLRFGWGRTGNSNIGMFQYQSQLDGFEQFSPVFGVDHTMAPALNVVHSFGNLALRWEAAEMLNFGTDINLFEDQLQFSAEYYIKDQNDLLVMVPVSSSFGRNYQGEAGETTAGDPWINIGDIENRGFEFNVIYSEMKGDFNYNLSANLTTIKNTVDFVPAAIIDDNFGHNITQVGNSIGSFYGYIAEEIITPEDFNEDGDYLFAEPASGIPEPGDLRFKDLNSDGIIDDTDRTIIGKALPDLTWSFNMELIYKSFDVTAFFYGMHDYQIYNHQRAAIEGFSSQDMDHNKLTHYAMNYYGRPDPVTGEPIPSDQYFRADMENSNLNDRASTWFLEDASFVRLKDLQLGFRLPQGALQTIGMNSLRIYLSATNLITFTQYTGRDPEAPAGGDPLSPGNDNGAYPVPRIFTLGVQADI